ncbi:hypothetical protein KVV02_000718 [Mortierella alpina]|uniref:N-acetyltransferase domain-containing protein n=1 Tax=Mortierella alpina TaxID=64518 RepID=A0A9P8A0C2_MORAP|nr:hypothetical protein KVV02_000718 [Mortierella alpina]
MSSGRATHDEIEGGRTSEQASRSPSSGPEVGVEGQQENSGTRSSGRNSAAQNRYSQQQQQVQYAQEIIRHSMILQPPTQLQPYPQDPLRSSIIQQQPQSQPYPQDPLRQPVQPQHPLQQTSQRDSRMSAYQPTPQMQSTRPPSIDFSEPPGSPLPPYVARPPQAMKPPHYYQEIHHETQAAGQMEYMDATDERRGYGSGDALWMPGNSRSSRQAEEDIYQSAGQFNPEASSRSRNKSSDSSRKAECWSTFRDIAEFCPCLCMAVRIRNFEERDQERVRQLVLGGLAERWGSEFNPLFNQDVSDIHGYYFQRNGSTVAVLEDVESEMVIGCGILLPLPAEDVYNTWCAEPESTKASHEGLKLARMMRLSLANEHRGNGYAKKIIHYLVAKAREQGFDRILVETERHWTSAVGVYTAAGFTVVAEDADRVHYEYLL